MFTNIRISNGSIPKLENERIYTTDFNYHLRLEGLTSRITGFYTLFNKGMTSRFYFAQGLKGDGADFVNESVTNIARRHWGIEWSIDYQLNSSIKMLFAGTYGDYSYTNNPSVIIESDKYNGDMGNFGLSYLKGYRFGGSHQKAYSLGFEYNDPNYWWLQVSGNYLADNYISPSALSRTANFFLDADGLPFIDPLTGSQVSTDQLQELLEQQELGDVFLLNIVGGKSWKINNMYLGFFTGINNALGAVFKTGGFEQSRYVNYPLLKADQQRAKPLFGPKFWHGNPTTYFINLSVRY